MTFLGGEGSGAGAEAISIPVVSENFTKMGLETKWSWGETCAFTR
jgi:hypothetical protein